MIEYGGSGATTVVENGATSSQGLARACKGHWWASKIGRSGVEGQCRFHPILLHVTQSVYSAQTDSFLSRCFEPSPAYEWRPGAYVSAPAWLILDHQVTMCSSRNMPPRASLIEWRLAGACTIGSITGVLHPIHAVGAPGSHLLALRGNEVQYNLPVGTSFRVISKNLNLPCTVKYVGK